MTTQQDFTVVPLDKEKQAPTEYQDDSTSTSPGNVLDNDTSNDDDKAQRPTLREAFPRFLVLPHLLSKNAWILFVATSVVMIIYTWLYLGSLWSPLTRVQNVEIVFYNADKGFDYSTTPQQLVPLFQGITRNSSLGTIVESQIMDPAGTLNHVVNWVDKTQEEGWDYDSLVDYVDKGKSWGLLYIPANFSNNFLSFAPSTTSGPATAASAKPVAMEYVFDQGRSYATHSIVEKYVSKSMEALSRGFENNLLTSPANQTLLQVMHPTFWTQSIRFTETVMHPVLVYGQNFATYVVFIVLWIGSMLAVYSICKFLPNTIETVGVLTLGPDEPVPAGGKKPLPKFPAIRIVLARHTVSMMFSLLHTVFIWMVPQVLHGHQMAENFSGGYAFAFIWFTGWSFISMQFLLAHLLGVDGFQIPATMLMILMFTASGGVLDWIIMPGFFRVGKAFPFSYAVRGLRTIYFGSLENKMWINWLAIFGWIALPGLITLVMARSEIRQRRENMRRTATVSTEV
ncbi:hypothetical protein MVEG_05610 [Podila verticillata NRRL 6337]|nr:hypothetical protein MVEG_05610 [Podila verticillata NRRL 6337]